MEKLSKFVVFNLDEQKYALYLSIVETVVRVVEFTPLPQAPKIVKGIVNFHGQIIPVFNIRKRFNLPDKEINLNDHLIITHTSRRMAALIVDSVSDIISKSEKEIIKAAKILPEIKYVEGILKLKEGIILIHNLDKFLSLEEEKELENALKGEIRV